MTISTLKQKNENDDPDEDTAVSFEDDDDFVVSKGADGEPGNGDVREVDKKGAVSIYEAPGAYPVEDMPEDQMLWLMDNGRQRLTESCFQQAEYVGAGDEDDDGLVVESGTESRTCTGRRAFKSRGI